MPNSPWNDKSSGSDVELFLRYIHKPNTVIEKIMDDVLSIPATEAVCERLFRICSGIARRNYVTKIKPETVQTLTTLHYFREAAIALLSHKDVVAHL